MGPADFLQFSHSLGLKECRNKEKNNPDLDLKYRSVDRVIHFKRFQFNHVLL